MLQQLRKIQTAEHLKAVKANTINIHTYSEKYLNQQPLEKKIQ